MRSERGEDGGKGGERQSQRDKRKRENSVKTNKPAIKKKHQEYNYMHIYAGRRCDNESSLMHQLFLGSQETFESVHHAFPISIQI